MGGYRGLQAGSNRTDAVLSGVTGIPRLFSLLLLFLPDDFHFPPAIASSGSAGAEYSSHTHR